MCLITVGKSLFNSFQTDKELRPGKSNLEIYSRKIIKIIHHSFSRVVFYIFSWSFFPETEKLKELKISYPKYPPFKSLYCEIFENSGFPNQLQYYATSCSFLSFCWTISLD